MVQLFVTLIETLRVEVADPLRASRALTSSSSATATAPIFLIDALIELRERAENVMSALTAASVPTLVAGAWSAVLLELGGERRAPRKAVVCAHETAAIAINCAESNPKFLCAAAHRCARGRGGRDHSGADRDQVPRIAGPSPRG